MKVKSFLPVLIISTILSSGCQNNSVPITPQSSTPSQTNNTVVDSVKTDVGEFKFTKVSTSKLAEYNNLISQNIQGNKQSAPETAPRATSNVAVSAPSIGATGGGVSSSASFAAPVAPTSDIARSSAGAYPISYFPYAGSFEEYTVVDFEEAKSGGLSGTYTDIVNKIIKPTIKNLAPDARMTSVNGNLDKDGLNKNLPQPSSSPTPYYSYNNYQWTFSFVSSSKKEVYNFYISSTETLILRQKWGLKDFSLDNVKVDSAQAIKILTDAIKNKNMKPTQEQYLGPTSEFLYDIPNKDISWNLYMEKEKSTLIWNVNMNINYSPAYYPYPMPLYAADSTAGSAGVATSAGAAVVTPIPSPMPIDYYYSGAYARINAETGEILMFNRPSRTKYEPYPVYPPVYATATPSYPETKPTIIPSPSPTMSSSPTPEPKPTAVVTK